MSRNNAQKMLLLVLVALLIPSFPPFDHMPPAANF